MSQVVPLVVPLNDPLACDPDVAGAKAANLARCSVAGLPTLPGAALTTAATARGLGDAEVVAALRSLWDGLARPGRALVVRSSSTIEDAGASSMAGRFTSVLDVTTWDGFLAAVERVVASADAVRDTDGVARPIAVLVQPQLDTALGGVMFGVDPVTGDLDHLVVEAVATRPDALVSGAAVADHYVLTRRGRIVIHTTVGERVELPRRVRRGLARLAERADAVFGGPQDVEWAVGRTGSSDMPALWLLQSRPVTAVASGSAHAGRHVVTMGPGPVAETFPRPLTRLEVELWVEPLREGMVRALRATGAVSERHLTMSPVVATFGGRVAVDLGLLGATTAGGAWRRRVNPAAIGRRLGAAWRVGRLRVAVPRLATTVVEAVDADLNEVGDLRAVADAQLVDLLRRARAELATVHSYEMLCGMLLRPGDPGADGPPATLVALARLADARADGAPAHSDAALVAIAPELLALLPPSVRDQPELPRDAPSRGATTGSVDDLPLRDALRLRVRWVQELQCRTVTVLAGRLAPRLAAVVPATAASGPVDAVELVAHLGLDELQSLVAGHEPPGDLASRLVSVPGPPLPVTFRVDAAAAATGRRGDGNVARLGGDEVGRSDDGESRHGRRGGEGGTTRPTVCGLPAGGGPALGVVVHEPPDHARDDPTGGWVLVTEHLGPDLAVVLPYLAGLVAETGSALSHVAILARELGVATVAGASGAREALRPGCRVRVDGTRGEVVVLEPPTAHHTDTGPTERTGRTVTT